MTLAHLRNGDTLARLAVGFAVSVSTVWRYLREAIDLLAAIAPDLAQAAGRAAALAYAIIEGTLIPIDRVADQRPTTQDLHVHAVAFMLFRVIGPLVGDAAATRTDWSLGVPSDLAQQTLNAAS